jgi:ribonuclease VapC
MLAFLQGEAGADLVEDVLEAGDAICGAANWSEVAQKVRQRGADWDLARGLILSYGLAIEPVSEIDAERAARLWSDRPYLSLGDRLCLALAERLQQAAVTADAAWDDGDAVRQIRVSDPS